MNTAWVKGLLRTGKQFATQHAPEILMGMGTVGIGTSVILLIKDGPRVTYAIEGAEREKARRQAAENRKKGIEPVNKEGRVVIPYMEPLNLKEKVAATWRIYIPPVGIALFSVGCFWGAHGIDVKRQAVLAGLYATAEETLQEYQRKVIETIGKDQHEELRQAISDEKAEKEEKPREMPPTIGDTWFVIDKKTFPSSYIKIKEAQNEFNHKMLTQMYMSKSELYWLLDPSGQWLRPEKEDWHVGWTIDKLLILHVDNPCGPISTISYEDHEGLDYLPKPGFTNLL